MFLVAVFAFTSCEDRLLDEFQNPERHNPRPDEIVPGMFTQMLMTRFFVLDYGEWWWSISSGRGVPGYSQIAVRRPHPGEVVSFNQWDNIGTFEGGTPSYLPANGGVPAERFTRYYTDLRNYAMIRDEIELATGRDYTDNVIYLYTARVIKNVIGMQTVDNFNSIPFSEAFMGSKGLFYPKYDDPAEVYKSALNDLKELATLIPQAFNDMTPIARELFVKNDIAFRGNVANWVEYINAARLRHAVRMSGVDPDFARTHIQEAITNLPTTDLIWENPTANPMQPGRDNGAGIYVRALYEQAPALLAPNIIIHRMMKSGGLDYTPGEDDPRLPVLFTPTRYTNDNWQFNGVSGDWDAQTPYWPDMGGRSGTVDWRHPVLGLYTNAQGVQGLNGVPSMPDGNNWSGIPDNGWEGRAWDAGPGLTVRTFVNQPTDAGVNLRRWLWSGYSLYNIGTFTYGEIPSYMTSRAENDLFLAEVEMKGLANTGKSAAEHIRSSVINSTEFWYRVNGLSRFWSGQLGSVDSLKRVFAPDMPSSAIIEQFAAKVVDEFNAAAGEDGKMEIIMQQKYIHHNILNIYELFAELRRTRHPKIEKMFISGRAHEPMLERIRYHDTEQRNNENSYNAVVHEDNYLTPIFWVPQNKRNETYYMDGWLPRRGFLPLPDPNPNRPVPAAPAP